MIEPFLRDDALLQSIRSVNKKSDHFHLWWLGQSGFLLHWQNYYLLFDPYLSDSLTKKYADTDKPHIRMTMMAIDPNRLDMIDVVTSSHNHTDHLDAETLLPLMKANPRMSMVIPEANRAFVYHRLRCSRDWPLGVLVNHPIAIGPFRFHGIPAAHDKVDKDENGQHRYLGYVVQFGPWAVYHSGDTRWHDQLVPQLTRFEIDLALLPINGYRPQRRVAGNLDATEAVKLGQEADLGFIIPCHYDMFTFNTVDPQHFAALARAARQPFQILQCGEPWSSEILKPDLK